MPSYTAPPWYSILSIDLLIRVAKATIFSPILCWLYPFALRAQAFQWSMKPLRYGVAFAITVDILWILSLLNAYVRQGKFSRRQTRVEDTDEDEEVDDVVVVTGGSSGLGQLVAEMFALKGISVAVVDVKKPNMEGNYALQYYECDVSDPDALASTAAQITKDLGTPTILVNCAVALDSNDFLIDIPLATIQKEIAVNILGNFYTIKQFLPGMQQIQRGHIVTISSALGFCGPAKLTTYSTSKAALLSLHESLTAELGLESPVKTTLVVAGQLHTPLFYGVETPNSFVAPIVEPLDVARQIVNAIEKRQGGEIYAPWYVNYMWIMRGLPVSLHWFLRWLVGMDRAMNSWRGPRKFAVEQDITFENGKY